MQIHRSYPLRLAVMGTVFSSVSALFGVDEFVFDLFSIGYVGFDPTLQTVVVAHQGTDTSEM
jgi:hypothetical protein